MPPTNGHEDNDERGHEPGNRRLLCGGERLRAVAAWNEIQPSRNLGTDPDWPRVMRSSTGNAAGAEFRGKVRLGAYGPAVAQVVHQLGGFGRIDAPLGQRRDDLIVGTIIRPSAGWRVRYPSAKCRLSCRLRICLQPNGGRYKEAISRFRAARPKSISSLNTTPPRKAPRGALGVVWYHTGHTLDP